MKFSSVKIGKGKPSTRRKSKAWRKASRNSARSILFSWRCKMETGPLSLVSVDFGRGDSSVLTIWGYDAEGNLVLQDMCPVSPQAISTKWLDTHFSSERKTSVRASPQGISTKWLDTHLSSKRISSVRTSPGRKELLLFISCTNSASDNPGEHKPFWLRRRRSETPRHLPWPTRWWSSSILLIQKWRKQRRRRKL